MDNPQLPLVPDWLKRAHGWMQPKAAVQIYDPVPDWDSPVIGSRIVHEGMWA